jgi:hypothetical protein
MMFSKIVGPVRLDSGTNGALKSYPLPPRGGGRMCKVVQYMVKVVQSSGSTARVTVRMDHGPDGNVFTTHSTPISAVDPTTGGTVALPAVVAGDATTSIIVGEFIQCVPGASSSDSNPSWVVVEIFEMRKPF